MGKGRRSPMPKASMAPMKSGGMMHSKSQMNKMMKQAHRMTTPKKK